MNNFKYSIMDDFQDKIIETCFINEFNEKYKNNVAPKLNMLIYKNKEDHYDIREICVTE